MPQQIPSSSQSIAGELIRKCSRCRSVLSSGNSSRCDKCIAYMKDWRAAHPSYAHEYYARNRKKLAAKQKRWRASISGTDKDERRKIKSRARSSKWRALNTEYFQEYLRRYALKNPLKISAIRRGYKARKKGASGTHSDRDISAILQDQNWKCRWCDAVLLKFHIDHVIPLVKGGSNSPENLCAACPKCNQSKGGRSPDEWPQNPRRRTYP